MDSQSASALAKQLEDDPTRADKMLQGGAGREWWANPHHGDPKPKANPLGKPSQSPAGEALRAKGKKDDENKENDAGKADEEEEDEEEESEEEDDDQEGEEEENHVLQPDDEAEAFKEKL